MRESPVKCSHRLLAYQVGGSRQHNAIVILLLYPFALYRGKQSRRLPSLTMLSPLTLIGQARGTHLFEQYQMFISL